MLLGGRALKCSVPEFAAGSELFISVSMVLRDEKLASFEGVICIKQEKDNLQVGKRTAEYILSQTRMNFLS